MCLNIVDVIINMFIYLCDLLLYGYGSYGHSIPPSFSTTRLSLINRDIIWATAHIRGGMERGMKYWEEGKMMNKKNRKP